MKKIKYILFLLFLALPVIASAYQPRLVSEDAQVVKIKNPEVSQAFYDTLDGQPAVYKISAEESFNLYVEILVPDIEDHRKDFIIEINGIPPITSSVIPLHSILDGQNYSWTEFHEEFTGDDYWSGPKFSNQEGGLVSEGDYTITVSNKDNAGKYVLVVGYIEEFPKEEIESAAEIIPIIKTEFFGKSSWSVFEGEVGKMALMGTLVFLVIISSITIILMVIIRKLKKKKK